MGSLIFRKGEGQTYIDYMMGFPSVKEWLNSKGSQSTKVVYAWGFYQFCKETGIDPEILLKERQKEAANQNPKVKFHAEDRLREFSQRRGATSSTFSIGASVKSFYAFHRYGLAEKLADYEKASPADYIPTQSEILKMYLSIEKLGHSTTARSKALLLFATESGQRPQTLSRLTYGDIKTDFEKGTIPMMINIKGTISKAHVASVSFCLDDAVAALKAYFEERKKDGEAITDSSPLFAAKVNKALTPNEITQLFHVLGRVIGLPVGTKGQYRFRGYCLRKRFQSVFEERSVHPNIIDALMNHKASHGADASSYSRHTPEKLREVYRSAAESLYILPEYVQKLSENPSLALDYEAIKRAFEYIPQSQFKFSERRSMIDKIDNDKSLSLEEKRDRVGQIVQQASIENRLGSEMWVQDMIPISELEPLIKSGEAEFITRLDDKVIIKRKKKIEADEGLAHQHIRMNYP